jgi:hypothetical protein
LLEFFSISHSSKVAPPTDILNDTPKNFSSFFQLQLWHRIPLLIDPPGFAGKE